jgi:hypothetical protein
MDVSVQPIVDVIVADRARFERFVRSLSQEELLRPVPDSTWLVKDFVSHLATLDATIIPWFASIVDGSTASLGGGKAFDIDAYNDAKVAKRRDRPIEEILAEAAGERAELLALMDRFSDAALTQNIHFGGDSKRPSSDIEFGRYLRGWARHDAIHTADMLKALPDRRDAPELAAWLAEPEVAGFIGFYQQAMA